MRITAGKITRPQKGVIYGCEGVGKSTFASKFPNPPERSPQAYLARYRHGRKDNHRPLTVLEDRRRPPSGNPTCFESSFNRTFTRIKRRKNLPDRLATPLA